MNKSRRGIEMMIVSSHHIYHHPLIRTLELARYARFMSLAWALV